MLSNMSENNFQKIHWSKDSLKQIERTEYLVLYENSLQICSVCKKFICCHRKTNRYGLLKSLEEFYNFLEGTFFSKLNLLITSYQIIIFYFWRTVFFNYFYNIDCFNYFLLNIRFWSR